MSMLQPLCASTSPNATLNYGVLLTALSPATALHAAGLATPLKDVYVHRCPWTTPSSLHAT